MKSVHLELPEDLLARVDEAAGDIPRNRWIRRAIEQALTVPSGPTGSPRAIVENVANVTLPANRADAFRQATQRRSKS